MPSNQWAFGDKVVHTAKPEWGVGVVTAATKTSHEGKPCQSVTVRFERAGVKSLSTAFASLVDASQVETLRNGSAGHIDPEPHGSSDSILEAKLGLTRDPKELMTKLPESTTDPFTTPLQRFRATASLYRFTPTGGSLLDWAAAQSGLADPLSRFNRHELERFFEQFTVVRDAHFRKTAQEARKADPPGLAQAISQAPPAAQQALRRLDAFR